MGGEESNKLHDEHVLPAPLLGQGLWTSWPDRDQTPVGVLRR